MLKFIIYKLAGFSASHEDYFTQLLDELKERGYLSPNIDEIIITDDLDGEIGNSVDADPSNGHIDPPWGFGSSKLDGMTILPFFS